MSLDWIAPALRPLAVPISNLRPDPDNTRLHDRINIEAIKASLLKFGQRKSIVCQKDGTIEAGNGTLEAALELGFTHLAVVAFDDSPAIAKAYSVADNRSAELATWDEPKLAETFRYLSEDVTFDFGDIGFTTAEVEAILGTTDDGAGAGGDLYTKKIQAPIYEPTGEKPSVASLVDRAKADELLKEIDEAAGLTQDEKAFLRYAAGRHRVFNYEKIAEFYAHAPKPLQELMERSALVIIDFEKAIEQGFVTMAKKFSEAYTGDDKDA